MAWQCLKTSGADWTNKLFSVDLPSVVQDVRFDLAVSDTIANNADAENMDVIVKFDDMAPNQFANAITPSFQISIDVEEQIATGVWTGIAESFGRQYNSMQPSEVVARFVIQTRNTTDPGQPFSGIEGHTWFVNAAPSEDLRVRVSAVEFNPSGAGQLVSANITGSYRLY